MLHVEDPSGAVVIRQDRLTSTSFAVSGLAAGNYRAWVKAIDSATDLFATGFWSRGLNFSVAETDAEESREEESSLDPLRQEPAEAQLVMVANSERQIVATEVGRSEEQVLSPQETGANSARQAGADQSEEALAVVDLLMGDHFDLAEALMNTRA